MIVYCAKMETAILRKILFLDSISGAGIFAVEPGDCKWVGQVNMKPDIGDVLIAREPLEKVTHPRYGVQYKTPFIEVQYPDQPKYIKSKLIKIFGKICGLPTDNNEIWELLRSKSPTIPANLCERFAEYHAAKCIVKGLALFLFERRIKWPQRLIFDVENGLPDIATIMRMDLPEALIILANSHEFPSDKFALLYDFAPEGDLKIRIQMIEVARKYEDKDGNTIIPFKKFYERCKIQQDIMGVRAYLRKYPDFIRDGDNIAREYIYNMEKYIAERLRELAARPARNDWEPRVDGALSPTQEAAIKMIFENRISIIMGAAGTGKSTVLLSAASMPNIKIHILAPTGKAVSRLREGRRSDVIMTIHRWNIMPPLITDEPDLIFIDEASMLDIPTFYKFLHIIPEKAHICLMGDPYQLPSVGIGCVFMKYPNIASIELDTVFRQQNNMGLMTAINSVRNANVRGALDAGILIEANTASDIERALEPFITDNTMIITPLNSIVNSLTPLVRQKLNPDAPANMWTIGDRVIQTVNMSQKDRYNGQSGVITSLSRDGKYTVRFCTGEEQIYNRLDAENQLALAYVLSVHKSQGSEADNVIVVLPTTLNCRLLTNKLIYTAVSRAKKSVRVIGPRAVFKSMIKNCEPPRVTYLTS